MRVADAVLEFEDEDDDCEWKFELQEWVKLILTGETGYVYGRRERLGCEDHYELIYRDGNGCQVTKEFPEGAIESIGTRH